jgi:hypothetical protein
MRNGRGRILFSPSPKCPDWLWGPPRLSWNEHQRLLSRGKSNESENLRWFVSLALILKKKITSFNVVI